MASDTPDNPGHEFGDEELGPDGQPVKKLYAGKYETVPDLEKGYSESFAEIARIRTERAADQARMAALEVAIQQQAQRPVQKEPEPPFLEVTEEGLPRDQVRRLAAEEARQAVAEALGPLIRGADARTDMLRTAPDYAQHEVQVQQFLAANPEKLATYNRIAAVDPRAALEVAFSQYRSEHPSVSEADRGEINRNKVQAGLPNGAAATGRPQDTGDQLNPRILQGLYEEAKTSGDWEKFLGYRLRGVIPQQFNPR